MIDHALLPRIHRFAIVKKMGNYSGTLECCAACGGGKRRDKRGLRALQALLPPRPAKGPARPLGYLSPRQDPPC